MVGSKIEASAHSVQLSFEEIHLLHWGEQVRQLLETKSKNWPSGQEEIHYVPYNENIPVHDRQSFAVAPSQVKQVPSHGWQVLFDTSSYLLGGHVRTHVVPSKKFGAPQLKQSFAVSPLQVRQLRSHGHVFPT